MPSPEFTVLPPFDDELNERLSRAGLGEVEEFILPAAQEYTIDDIVLPYTKLHDPCQVSVTVGADIVCLKVGPRDWEWDRKTGALLSCGSDAIEER